MPTFNDFLTTLKNDLLDFTKENLEEYKDEILKDGNVFVEKTKEDLQRWTEGLASGALSQADFEFLLKASRQEKVLVFTQFRETTAPLAEFLAGVFGRPGVVLHGGTPVRQRKEVVSRFQETNAFRSSCFRSKPGASG